MLKNQLPTIYRKRYVPTETIPLYADTILLKEDKLLVTFWHTLKARPDISHGISAYYTSKGYKISKVYDHEGRLVYWYCDIIRTIRNPVQNTITFEDLLLDVIIDKDGRYQVIDIDELVSAYQKEIISCDLMLEALTKLDGFLRLLYTDEFKEIQSFIESFEDKVEL